MTHLPSSPISCTYPPQQPHLTASRPLPASRPLWLHVQPHGPAVPAQAKLSAAQGPGTRCSYIWNTLPDWPMAGSPQGSIRSTLLLLPRESSPLSTVFGFIASLFWLLEGSAQLLRVQLPYPDTCPFFCPCAPRPWICLVLLSLLFISR